MSEIGRKAESFAKYHRKHAAYRGPSQEFHERAATFLGDVEALIVAARAEGFAAAREQAAVIAGAMAHNCGVAAAGMRTEPNQRAWLKAQEMSADVEQSIRAMQDGVVSKECEGAPDCGWHNGGPCDPCKAKVSP